MPQSSVLAVTRTTSYNFSVEMPDDGLYHLVVNNLSTLMVTGQLIAAVATSTFVTVTSLMYSLLTQQNVQTLSLITLAESAAQGTSVNTLTVSALAIVIVIIVIALIAMGKHTKARTK